jgi:hypothetical protein
MPCKKRSRTDCWADAWHAGEMAKAVKMGTFMLDTKMRPNDGITRQEAFTVLARAFKLVGEGELKALDRFSDKGDIASWALASLAGMTAEGYIQGSDGKLQPQANITRAEFATIMNNLVKQYIDSAEEVNEVADGNVIIRVPGVTLKDVTVKGDLIIADGVGDGDVTLDNVTVQGRTVVRGGGVDSIIIKGNSDVGKVIVAKVDGEIRIYVEGGAEVEIIYVDDGSDDVIVEGTIGELEVAGESVTVYARDADIGGATVSGDNSKIVVGDGSKVKNGNITGASSAIVVDEGGSVDKVAVSGSGASVEGEGEVKEVEVKEGGDGASITTPKTKTVVDQGVEGVEAGGTPVEGGQTATNNDTGTGATVGDTPPPSGGTSRPPKPQVHGITIEASVLRGGEWKNNHNGFFMEPFCQDDKNEVRVKLGTATPEAKIYYTLYVTKPEGAIKAIGPEEITEVGMKLNAEELFKEVFEDEFNGDITYGGLVVMKVLAKKDGYIDRTEEFTFAFAAEKVNVGTLAKDYYSVGDDLEFTIHDLRPNKKVEVGMPIHIGGGWPWACDELVLLNMKEIPEGRYWITEADENGGITVSGKVGPDLTYGQLCITLPWSGHVIDNAMGLWHGENTPIYVGGAVSVEGEPFVGRTLTTSVQPVGAMVKYEWQRAVDWDGDYENIERATFKEIPGAISSTYKIDGEDLKSLIRVKVTSTEESDYRWGTSYSYPVGPVVWDATVSQLEFDYYAAEANLEFIISGLESNKEVKVGMPILIYDGRHDDPPSMVWASGKRVLTTNMDEVEGGLYWIGTTDEDGKLTVSGTVGANLPYGELHITLPEYGYYIDDAIGLGAHVGMHTVTFDEDGIEDQRVPHGDKAIKPENPADREREEGSHGTEWEYFVAWHTEHPKEGQEWGTAYDFNTTVDADINLYARWEGYARVFFILNDASPGDIEIYIKKFIGENQHGTIADLTIEDFKLAKKVNEGEDESIDNLKLEGLNGDYTISLESGNFADGFYKLIFAKERYVSGGPLFGTNQDGYFEISATKSEAKALINSKTVEVASGKGEDKSAVLAAIKALDKTGNTLIADLTENDIEIEGNRATVDFGGGITAEVTIIEVD